MLKLDKNSLILQKSTMLIISNLGNLARISFDKDLGS